MEVIIVGGGIGGLTAALCLANAGIGVTVLEQSARITEIGAGIQISPNGNRVLHGLGLREALDRAAFRPLMSERRDWRTGDVLAGAPLGDAVIQKHGFPYYHIHRADLIGVLAEAAAAHSGIHLETGVRVDSVDQSNDGVEARLADGTTRRAHVLIGADGIRSVVREALFGPDAPDFTGNIAWRSLIPVERLPEGMVRPASTAWWGPGRHFVHYYVRAGSHVNCVAVVEKEGWEVESWTERGDIAELRADFDGWHDDIQTLIGVMDPAACFKWALFDRKPMQRWGKGRISLLGDACHATLPFMAQGAVMAIEDGAVLAGCLSTIDDVPSALQRYEDLRRDRTAAIQYGSRRNAKLFHLREAEAGERNETAAQDYRRTIDGLFAYDALSAHLDGGG